MNIEKANKQQFKRRRNERVNLTKKIMELYVENSYTLKSCCEAHNVEYSTFRSWAAPTLDNFDLLDKTTQNRLLRRGFVHEVHTLYKRAEIERNKLFRVKLVESAWAGIERLLVGHKLTETNKQLRVNKEGELKLNKVVVREYEVLPSIVAIIFVLTNLDPENWKNKLYINNKTVQRPVKSDLENMTDEQLNKEIKRLEIILKKQV